MANKIEYTSNPITCGHCRNVGIMFISATYNDTKLVEPDDEPPYEYGKIYNILTCPACHKVSLRSYNWNDQMESEDEVTYHILYPAAQDYGGRMEQFLPRGSQHDAFVAIRDIVQTVTSSVFIIDPYLDHTIFTLLSVVPPSCRSIQMLTSNKMPNDFKMESRKFQSQYANLNLLIRTSRDFHDRFIVVNQSEVFHLGASIKDAGDKAFQISKLCDENNLRAFLHAQQECWNAATAFIF